MQDFTTPAEWAEIKDESKDHPVIIFKHSNTCPISAGAHHRVHTGIESGQLKVPLYRLIVQDAPDLKIDIARELKVHHESPQIIILKNGEATYNASHGDIQVAEIIENL